MTPRQLVREFRDFPATTFLACCWILVFASMIALRLQEPPRPTAWQLMVLGMGEGHRFGDLTVADLSQGQVWRLITSTFVHYSFIHITLNLLGFYILGTLLESWYGPTQLVLIYGLTGGLGNLVSVLIRRALGANPHVHAGGGSVVIMGLIGLCAVVGWRSRKAMGDLGWQMSKALALTAILGIAFPRYIDNWGHLGGALVGFALGFLHPWFLRQFTRPAGWGPGVVTGLVIAGCGIAQFQADRRAAPQRRAARARSELLNLERAYASLVAAGAAFNQPIDLRLLEPLIRNAEAAVGHGATRADYQRLHALALAAGARTLSDEEKKEFHERARALAGGLKPQLRGELRDFWRERHRPAVSSPGRD